MAGTPELVQVVVENAVYKGSNLAGMMSTMDPFVVRGVVCC